MRKVSRDGSGPAAWSRFRCRSPCRCRQHLPRPRLCRLRVSARRREVPQCWVMNAFAPIDASSISSSAVAAAQPFAPSRWRGPRCRRPSIRRKASRSPAGSTTAIAEGAFCCCALSLALADRLGSGLIENHHVDGCASLTGRRPLPIFRHQFQVSSWRADFSFVKVWRSRMLSLRACVAVYESPLVRANSPRSLWRVRADRSL